MLANSSAAPLITSGGQRLSLWERGLDLAVVTSEAAKASVAVTETLRRYPARLLVAPSPGDARQVSLLAAQKGQAVDLGPAARLEVVDVRDYGDQPVVDLKIVAGDLAVWLPGPGPPSPAWSDVATATRQVVLSLPSRPSAWLRTAPAAPWLAVVAQAPVTLPPSWGGPTLLDHQTFGSIELVVAEEGPSLRLERCSGGGSCLVRVR